MATVSEMDIREIRNVLEHARKTAEPWPNNRRVRETLASWTVEVAKQAFESASDTTHDNETNEIHNALCAVRNTDEGALPAPAPGHHDDMRFPEFALQQGIENMAGKVENGIAVWRQHIAAAAPHSSVVGRFRNKLGPAGWQRDPGRWCHSSWQLHGERPASIDASRQV